MINKSENSFHFIDNLEKTYQAINSKRPQWLAQQCQKNLTRLLEAGLPTIKDEEWKYTNIKSIADHTYAVPEHPKGSFHDLLGDLCSPTEISVVFVNGKLASHLSNFTGATKLKISSLEEAIADPKNNLEPLFNTFDPKQANVFVSLNEALTEEGVLIQVPEKFSVDKLIHIIHLTTDNKRNILSVPRTIIALGKLAQAAVLETHISPHHGSIYLASPLTDILVSEGAVVKYCKAQSESANAFHMGTTRVWQERDSNFNGFSMMNGAKITRNNLDIILNGEGASGTLNGLYCVNDAQHVDNHTCVDHRVPNCTSNQLYKGILNGSSRAVFNGKIFVRAIAQKTNSYQLNKNLLLGKDCRVDTKPQLEISADDVKCTHGATIGQLNEDEIFYLRSRAIAKRTAIKMLSKGFVDEIINHIENESISQRLNKLLEPTFAAL
ncbi:MAG: Fe-S cluster assembly protein SufD [Omnitrophica WOR_2 bacterium GWA2_47_8]|nr:MAG: Fe-S cluster assembly protein SufD [Omnitrophica WOR_2 bacterium GWA2_47_8]